MGNFSLKIDGYEIIWMTAVQENTRESYYMEYYKTDFEKTEHVRGELVPTSSITYLRKNN